MSDSKIDVACFGFSERELSIIKSLISIISGRKKTDWSFQEDIDLANVIIILATTPGAALALASKARRPELRILLARPEGSFPPPHSNNIIIVRYPLRSTELLEVFDQLEQQWPFAAQTPAPTGFSSRLTIPPTASPTSQPEPAMQRASSLPQSLVEDLTARASLQSNASLLDPTETSTVSVVRKAAKPPPMPNATPASERVSALYRQPATTIGQLVGAVELLRSPLGGQKFIDLFDSAGWIARISPELGRIMVSSRFAIGHKSDRRAGFRWQFVKKSDDIPVGSGDAAVLMDFEVLAWLTVRCFGRTLKKLDMPQEAKLHLKRWPDFGVFSEFTNRPGVMLATALLARRRIRIDMLMNETGIAEKDLCCLLGASWLCGWLELDTQKTIPNETPEEEPQYEAKRFSPFIRGLRKILGLDRSRRK